MAAWFGPASGDEHPLIVSLDCNWGSGRAAQQLTVGLRLAPEQSSPDTAPAVFAAVTENQSILAAASEPATLLSAASCPGIAPASKPAAGVPAAAGR